jgi:hypothetical protein
LESVLRMFPAPGVDRSRLAEFGTSPTEECLVSLARGLREAGWGRIELRPSWEWLTYSSWSIAGAILLLVTMVLLLTQLPVSGAGSDSPGFLLIALAVQWLFYLVCIAFFMMLSAGRASGIVQAAAPKGLRTSDLEDSLGLAHDPFEKIRLVLGALPSDDQKSLLEAMHYALWKVVRTYKAASGARSSKPQRQTPSA